MNQMFGIVEGFNGVYTVQFAKQLETRCNNKRENIKYANWGRL